jgi:monooxygenase
MTMGIDAAYHLRTSCPGKSFVILESCDAIGSTWDLFRYPGIRSDSDMFTFGYPFRPWLIECRNRRRPIDSHLHS